MSKKNNTKDILKSIQRLLPRRRLDYRRRVMHPVRDWLIGLLLFAIVVIAGGVYCAQTFVTYRNVNTEGGTIDETIIQYNRMMVEQALEAYTARKEAYDTAEISAPETTADTSTTTDSSEDVEASDSSEASAPAGDVLLAN